MSTTIDVVMATLNKTYGRTLIRRGVEYEQIPRIPFRSPRANWMTYGGIPQGRVTELFGPDNGGKTTSALDLVASAQRLATDEWKARTKALKGATGKKAQQELDELKELGPRRILYVDTEGTLDKEWAERLGVKVDDLLVLSPQEQSAEQVLQMILDLIDSGAVYLAVLDSVPMLVPQKTYEETLDKKEYGGISGVMTDFCRKLVPRLTHWNTTFISINQSRDDLGNVYNIFKTPGGRMLKHVASLRIYVRRGSFLSADGEELKPSAAEHPGGNVVEMQIVKTKVFPPNRRLGSYTLDYARGVDTLADLLDMAQYFGLIERAGAYFSWAYHNETHKAQGRAGLRAYFAEHPDEQAYLEAALEAAWAKEA